MRIAVHCRDCGKFAQSTKALETCKPYDWSYRDTIQYDLGVLERILASDAGKDTAVDKSRTQVISMYKAALAKMSTKVKDGNGSAFRRFTTGYTPNRRAKKTRKKILKLTAEAFSAVGVSPPKRPKMRKGSDHSGCLS